jgi:hypothetical protein
MNETRPVGRLIWHLLADCPYCEKKFDVAVVDAESDYVIARLIFNNKWDAVLGCDLICSNCEYEF